MILTREMTKASFNPRFMAIKVPSIKELFDNALYFGHRTSHWNPRFKQYIWGDKGGVHVIDLNKTHEKLKEALEFLANQASQGKELLIVGTKTQARNIMRENLKGSNIHYVATKWLPGLLTNFNTVKKRIQHYNKLIEMRESGEIKNYTKKEIATFSREIKKLETMIGGVLNMNKVPDIIFILDINKEKTALKEAKVCKIKIVGLVDSNSNPDDVDYVIPGNDDSKKGLDFIVNIVKSTWLDNLKEKAKKVPKEASAEKKKEIKPKTSKDNTTESKASDKKTKSEE